MLSPFLDALPRFELPLEGGLGFLAVTDQGATSFSCLTGHETLSDNATEKDIPVGFWIENAVTGDLRSAEAASLKVVDARSIWRPFLRRGWLGVLIA